MGVLRYLGYTVLALVTIGVGLRLLNPLPSLEGRAASHAIAATGETPIGAGSLSLARAKDGESGLYHLNDGRSAFATRVLLAREAVRSLDIQYYLWKGDLSGTLLLNELRQAADRGVRVRLLLDDNGVSGMDGPLAALNRHPNIEVRLYNPFTIRAPKWLGYVLDFPRLNRRMHNKSFTADGAATVVGGRNVGDEYFGAQDQGLFADLDALAIGPVARDVSVQFDRYWNSASAYPAELILPAVPPSDIGRIASGANTAAGAPESRAYLQAVRTLPLVARLRNGALPLEWARVHMMADDPAKTLGKAAPDALLFTKLTAVMGRAKRQLALVSGYFVPTDAGTAELTGLSRSGVHVSVLTNAFETTDVPVVHAGYAPRREALLRAGVRLFEMRKLAGQGSTPAAENRTVLGSGGSGSGSDGSSGAGPVVRASASMLHAKTFAVDEQRLFVGSFNFDPRSIHLNTEMGFVSDSAPLASVVGAAFQDQIPLRAYEVRLTRNGDLMWLERTRDGRVIRHDREPGTTGMQRLMIGTLSRLPIEWLL